LSTPFVLEHSRWRPVNDCRSRSGGDRPTFIAGRKSVERLTRGSAS
jgi:hypothetical protein